MLYHYLKISFRSLMKCRQQTVISVIGLSVGFVCFALSVLWIRYERSFDKFHPGYERIFAVVRVSALDESGISVATQRPLSRKLKELYPEVEEACSASYFVSFTFDDKKTSLNKVEVDSNFFKVFDIPLRHRKAGEVLIGKNSAVITDKCVEKLSPDGSLNIGDRFTYKQYGKENEFFVDEIMKAWPQNTNFPFDIAFPLPQENLDEWSLSNLLTFVKVREGVDVEEFKKKVESYNVTQGKSFDCYVRLVPISEWYYTVSTKDRTIKYQYIVLFSFAGLLVIFCALFNYLALFISRLRMRGKEMVLRKVCGAGGWQLLCQLLIEFLLVLFFSVLLGFLLIEWVFPEFQLLAAVKLSKLSVFFELFMYVLFLMTISILVSLYPILYFRRCTVQSELMGNSARSRNVFSRVCIWIQFCISIFFIYCTVVMMRQIYHLNHVDLGFSRENIVQFSFGKDQAALLNELRNLPTVKCATGLRTTLFLPSFGWASRNIKGVDVEMKEINVDVIEMLDLRLKEGGMIVQRDRRGVLLNESAVNALGKSYVKDTLGVEGIVQDFLFESPLRKSRPIEFFCSDDYPIGVIMLKYQDGTRYQTEKAIMKLIEDKFDNEKVLLFYMEDEYDKYLKSEKSMVLLLSILSIVCVLVALFGIYSMVSLACERRRKEIAVRKVNGAEAGSLLLLFMKEYFYLLLSASAVAFLAGYKVMQSWIENYINRINIGAWIYAAILCLIILLVAAIVMIRVWRTIRANPSEELKRE